MTTTLPSSRPGRQLSIAAKLPLAVAALIAVFLAAMALAAYVEVRSSALTRADDRMEQVGKQIVDLIAPSVARSISTMKAQAAWPETRAILAAPTDEARATFVERVEQLPRQQASISVEIWDAARRRVFSTGPSLPPVPDPLAADVAARAVREGAAIGPFAESEGAIMQLQVAAVIKDGVVTGYFVDRRPISNAAQFLALLRNLIGAKLLVGNDSGNLWIDFSKKVEGPPVSLAGAADLVSYVRGDGTAVFGRAMPIAGTPWVLVVELPQAPVLAPVRRFVGRAAILSLILAVVAAGVGWGLSRRVTKPLRRMTEAAVNIAEGRSTERIALARSDELGQMAGAFDTMVAALRESQDQLRAANAGLEQRVAERTAEMTEANRELEAFTYSVSHDLRAPLRAIAGFSRILIENHGTELEPEAAAHVRTIARNVKAMGQLIDDLLTFSRLSRQPMGRDVTDMSALARNAIQQIERTEMNRNIEFVLTPLPPAYAERSLVRHVVDNLVQNAAKFTSTRERARIEIGHVHDGHDVTYFVRDNGVGFDMTYADKLFGVFQRLHRSDEFEGTGVGLAIVHRIVSRHGGRVWAQSEVNNGATFYFTLPQGGVQ